MQPKTDYRLHEGRYRELRSRGAIGWDDEEQLADHLAELRFYETCEAVPTSGRLLELGCGAGDITLHYARRGYEVSGVDISETAIAWAQEKAKAEGLQADFHVGDVLAVTIDETFDIVLDGHCLHCIIGDDRARFLAEAKRLLKPTGVLLIGTMCGDPTSPRILDSFDPKSRCIYTGDIATRYLGEVDTLLAEIASAGLEVLAFEEQKRKSSDDQDMLLVVAR